MQQQAGNPHSFTPFVRIPSQGGKGKGNGVQCHNCKGPYFYVSIAMDIFEPT